MFTGEAGPGWCIISRLPDAIVESLRETKTAGGIYVPEMQAGDGKEFGVVEKCGVYHATQRTVGIIPELANFPLPAGSIVAYNDLAKFRMPLEGVDVIHTERILCYWKYPKKPEWWPEEKKREPMTRREAAMQPRRGLVAMEV